MIVHFVRYVVLESGSEMLLLLLVIMMLVICLIGETEIFFPA